MGILGCVGRETKRTELGQSKLKTQKSATASSASQSARYPDARWSIGLSQGYPPSAGRPFDQGPTRD